MTFLFFHEPCANCRIDVPRHHLTGATMGRGLISAAIIMNARVCCQLVINASRLGGSSLGA
jgi:hypothetical protein